MNAFLDLALRTERIEPFHAMELMKRAHAFERSGRSIVHMTIGEPDFTAPPEVVEALAAGMAAQRSRYTPALGIFELRAAIANFYRERYGLTVPAEQIVVTAGASGALLLTMAALVNPGDEILMPDPTYPCNRHFVSAFDGHARLIPAGPADRFQLSAEMVRQNWSPVTRGVLVASPSNPTGTSIAFHELESIAAEARRHGGVTIVDEIYHSLSYDEHPRSALELILGGAQDVIILNSFSKYFCMTGWRLGWLVCPAAWVPTFEKLAQNLFICASALAQHAALACFSPATLAICEQRKAELRRRRDYIVPALSALGFGIPVRPDGAFYIYTDISKFSSDSGLFADELLEKAGVAVVPGVDFGQNEPQRWLRLSYATSLSNLEEAVRRLSVFIQDRALSPRSEVGA
ncbi:MAG: pyridoxal phosphate-dependent aminotransferase [Burkholderiaceae bacterium]